RDPSRIFTTPHFGSPKYRPLNRLAILWTYQAGDGNPMPFRVRNLAFHLLNAALVYALGWTLFGSALVAGAAAAWFGLHPLANQSVIGATWTNTMAHSGFLLAIVMFTASLRARRWALWLTGALVSGWLALLTYDSSIVVFPLMALYFGLYVWLFRRRAAPRRFLVAGSAIAAALMVLYAAARMLFISDGLSHAASAVPAPGIIFRNISMYVFALLAPIDTVWANEWLNLPLPSDLHLDTNLVAALAAAALLPATGFAAAGTYAVRRHPELIRGADWAAVAFLLCAVALPLLPVLVFSSHPSETYLYLPVAFFALLLAYALGRIIDAAAPRRGRTAYIVVVLSLAAIFAAAIWTRNDRVVQCAATAHKIISGLPAGLSSGGPWTVSLTPAPDASQAPPYGFYRHRGIGTIGDDDDALTAALQFAYRNPFLTGELVEPAELAERCRSILSPRQICLTVYSDGRLETMDVSLGGKPEKISVPF
ncbi:MAG: hypothetical protein ACREQP_18050, partial [Candidatus Binatia bacterium]